MCGNEAGNGSTLPARRLVGRGDVELRRVDVEADEIVRRGDDLQFVGGEFRRVLAGILQKAIGVFALQDDAEEARRSIRASPSRRRERFRACRTPARRRRCFRPGRPWCRRALGADRLHRKAVRQHDVVAAWFSSRVRQFEAGRVDAPAIAEIQEPSGLVEREDRLDAIGQALRDIAGIIAECFRGFAGSPAADAVLQRLRQIPVIERRVWLDAVASSSSIRRL